MTIEIKVAQLPESVSDATLVGWHKQPGDAVKRDENLADLETDKVVLEVPAPVNGVLTEIRVADGTTVTEGEILAVSTKPPRRPARRRLLRLTRRRQRKSRRPLRPQRTMKSSHAAHRLSPAVRRLVDEHDLDPAMIKGTGKGGRINKADVLRHIDSHQSDVVHRRRRCARAVDRPPRR